MPMCTVDPRVCKIINDTCSLFDFNQLPVLHDIRACVLFSAFNYARVSADTSQSMFRRMMGKIDGISDKDKHVTFDKHFDDGKICMR